MARNIIGLLIGVFVAGVVTWSILSINAALYPAPAGSEEDPEIALKYLKELPHSAFIIELIAHALAALFGSWVASIIADSHQRMISLAIGCFLFLMGVGIILSGTRPVWFAIADAFMYVPFALLGYKIWQRTSRR